MQSQVKQDAPCYGKKFGHNFSVAGGRCAQCGIEQGELSGQFGKIEYFVKKPEKGIHSEMHVLAKEISEYCGELKKFAMYLGIIKNIGLGRTYKLFAELKQSKDVKDRGKLFVYLSSYLPRRQAGKKPKTGKKLSSKKKKLKPA